MSNAILEKPDSQIYAHAIQSLAAYFAEAARESGVPTHKQIELGLDHIFQPIPAFWAHFTHEMVLAALWIGCPKWKQKVDTPDGSGFFSFSTYISCALIDRILHDRLAQDFLTLPAAQRPSGEKAVNKWIRSHLSKVGATVMLTAIKAEGPRAAAKVLRWVSLREAAVEQKPTDEISGCVS